jgi:hypothetical protein
MVAGALQPTSSVVTSEASKIRAIISSPCSTSYRSRGHASSVLRHSGYLAIESSSRRRVLGLALAPHVAALGSVQAEIEVTTSRVCIQITQESIATTENTGPPAFTTAPGRIIASECLSPPPPLPHTCAAPPCLRPVCWGAPPHTARTSTYPPT